MAKVTGVVVGKFWPPHRGHKYLIETARSRCDDLIVFVCDGGEEIPVETRTRWLARIHPDVDVRAIKSLPQDRDDDSEAWAQYTIELLGGAPDVVFTSEAYGDAWARHMGCRHESVDQSRATFPVSGTEIRRDPLAHWENLEPAVRAHYAVRVVVIGAESSGTTTLARALAERLTTVWVPEYGRTYCEGRGLAAKWREDEFIHIAQIQNQMEDALAEQCNKTLICDTDAFATAVWHERYMQHRSPRVENLDRQTAALYLVTDAAIPFEQDGLRDGEHVREWMQGVFIERLRERQKPFTLVTGGPEARVSQALDAIEGVSPIRT